MSENPDDYLLDTNDQHSVLIVATLARENHSRLRTLLEDRAEILSLQGLTEPEVEELGRLAR